MFASKLLIIMLEHIADFTAWPILTGIFIGYIANRLISHLLNISLFGKGYITNFIFCVAGAVLVLWIWGIIFGRK